MFKKHREKKEAERGARQAEEAERIADAWRNYFAAWEPMVEAAQSFDGLTAAEADGCPVSLKKDERMFFALVSGAVLIEPRRSGGHWQGGSQGVSVRIPGTKSMRYRVGATRGTYAPGNDTPTLVDEGSFTVTNQRAVFMGAKATREWQWSKLVGVMHASDAPWTAISVSNRQKTSGVGCEEAHIDVVRFWIDLAIANANGTRDAFAREVADHLAEQRRIAAGDSPEPTTPQPAIAVYEASESPPASSISREALMRALVDAGFHDRSEVDEGFTMTNAEETVEGVRFKAFSHGDREQEVPAMAKALRDAGYAARVVRDGGGYPYVSIT